MSFFGKRKPGRNAIAEQNKYLLRQQRNFRAAADAVVDALRRFEEVEAISLIGSVAVPLWKEVPRFSDYRRYQIEVWHECKDCDLAVWLSRLDNLRELGKARSRALNQLMNERNIGVAHHQVEAFIMEPGTDRYLGRLCTFAQCPKPGKFECFVPDCGRAPFLKQIEKFKFYKNALEQSVRLFDRSSGGVVRRAADLPQPGAR